MVLIERDSSIGVSPTATRLVSLPRKLTSNGFGWDAIIGFLATCGARATNAEAATVDVMANSVAWDEEATKDAREVDDDMLGTLPREERFK